MDFEVDTPTPKPSIAIIALTRTGVNLALQIRSKLEDSVCYVPDRHRFALSMGAIGFERFGSVVPKIWAEHKALICIMATGIVVRQIGSLMRLKTVDPAVVVLDERGSFSISLLSGHLGGANELARRVAMITGGQAVITTASDVQEKPSIDLIAQEKGLEIENVPRLRIVARAILEDEPLNIFDPYSVLRPQLSRVTTARWIDESTLDEVVPEAPCVWACERLSPPGWTCLLLRPKNLVVGIGCNRNTPADEILELVRGVFEQQRLSLLSIRNLASIDLKSDERGLLEAAAYLRRPVYFYPRNQVEGIQVPNPSANVQKHVGVPSVCEATALLSALNGALIVPKQKTRNVTVAVVRAEYP
jgi:cobalt-precorrin 5A hydrolase